MSKKYNTGRGGKKAKNYGGGQGMQRHRAHGIAHNHANSIARVREYNQEQEKLAELKKKQKGKMFRTVKEVFES